MGFFRNMGRGEVCCTECGQETPCETCCPTELPIVEGRIRAASKTKPGFDTYSPTTPPQRYLRLVQSGSTTTTSYGQTCSMALDLVLEWYRDGTRAWTGGSNACSNPCTWSITSISFGSAPPGPYTSNLCFNENPAPGEFTESRTPTVLSFTGTGVEAAYQRITTGTGTSTLSDEYTTAMLEEDVLAALPETWTTAWPSSVRVLTASELTLSLREAEWRVIAPEDLVSGRTYRLYYLLRFLPESGPVEEGEERYIEIRGDEAGDPTDWHVLDMPEANGSNEVMLLRWECEPFDGEGEGA